MSFKSVLLAAALLCLVACSSNDEKKQALKAADLVDFEETIDIKKRWSVSVGDGFDKRYSRFLPAISADSIYVSDVDGRVYALDKSNGKRRWKTKLKKTDLSAGVGAHGDQVYVATYDGELIALSAEDGSELWKGKTSSEILSIPAANNEVAVAQTIDGRLFAFDAKTGEQLWRYDHIIPSLTLRGLADPVISRSQLIAAFDNGQLVSLNPSDGARTWEARVSQPSGGNELEKIIDVDGTPVVTGAFIFAATYQGGISAFSKLKGNAIWKQDLSTYNKLAATSSRVFGVTEESHIVAFNAANGAIEWTNNALHRRDLSSPMVWKEFLIAIDEDDHLHVMNQSDGDFVARFKPKGDGFRAGPIALNDGFLTLSDDGRLSYYELAEPKK